MARAGRRWQRTLFPWLKEYGFRQTDSDQSVFTLERMHVPHGPRTERLYVGVYVDDLAVVYSRDDEHSLYRDFIVALESRWNVKDEVELTDLLGIEFSRTSGAIELRQTTYIEKLAAEFFPACRPRRRPIKSHAIGTCPCSCTWLSSTVRRRSHDYFVSTRASAALSTPPPTLAPTHSLSPRAC
jgi:hypothetical protein